MRLITDNTTWHIPTSPCGKSQSQSGALTMRKRPLRTSKCRKANEPSAPLPRTGRKLLTYPKTSADGPTGPDPVQAHDAFAHDAWKAGHLRVWQTKNEHKTSHASQPPMLMVGSFKLEMYMGNHPRSLAFEIAPGKLIFTRPQAGRSCRSSSRLKFSAEPMKQRSWRGIHVRTRDGMLSPTWL